MDNIDKKILFELDKNARKSIKKIAHELKMKRSTLAYRIKQLEKNKIIQSYYAVIDYSKLGYNILVRIYIKFQNTSLEIEKEFIDYVLSQNETFTVYKTEGDWDLTIGFLGKKLSEFDRFYKKIKEKYKIYIHSQNISLFRQYIQYYRNYLVDKKVRDYSSLITGEGELVKVDEIDLKLLNLISENARISLLDLSKQLKMTSMTTRYRLKGLEKERILIGYRVLLNLSKLDYEYYKIDLEIEDIKKIKLLQQFAKQHPSIIYEDRTVGGSDFEFDAELQGYDAFYSLIEELKKEFPGLIKTYRYYKAKKIFKYSFFPKFN